MLCNSPSSTCVCVSVRQCRLQGEKFPKKPKKPFHRLLSELPRVSSVCHVRLVPSALQELKASPNICFSVGCIIRSLQPCDWFSQCV